MNREKLIKEINRLKIEKNAIILAHNYQIGEVQDIADFVGDSLQLAKEAIKVKQDLIIFCGVHFMAESAKILNPTKKVILPVKEAGCPMADMASAEEIREFKKKNPELKVVTYVNSSAEVKAESYVCCTSANAVDVVEKIGAKEVLFVPDKNLGSFVDEQIEDVKIMKWEGFCPTHERVTLEDVEIIREKHPAVKILVHPECRPEVFHAVDFVGSTSQIIEFVKNSEDKKFIIGTEKGIIHSLKKENPDKEFIILTEKLICENMKKTRLEDVYRALKNEEFEISLDEKTASKANEALERMLK
jgi:quinolinate synthase